MQFEVETLRHIVNAVSTADAVLAAVTRLDELNKRYPQTAFTDMIKLLIKIGPKWTVDAKDHLYKMGIELRKYFYDCAEYASMWSQVTEDLMKRDCISAVNIMLNDIPALLPEFGAKLVTRLLSKTYDTRIEFIHKLSAADIQAITLPDHIYASHKPIIIDLIKTGHLSPEQIHALSPFCRKYNIMIADAQYESEQLRARNAELEKQLADLQSKLNSLKAAFGGI